MTATAVARLAPDVVVVDANAVVAVCRRRCPLILREGHQFGRVVLSVVLLHHVEPEDRCRRRRLGRRRRRRLQRCAHAVFEAAVVSLPVGRDGGDRGGGGGGGGGIHRDLCGETHFRTMM